MSLKQFRLPAEVMKDTRGFTRRATPFFAVLSKPNKLSNSRLAVIVSAKVDRRSVLRNKLKRRVREYVRARPGELDIVVTVLPPAKSLLRKSFLEEMEKALPK